MTTLSRDNADQSGWPRRRFLQAASATALGMALATALPTGADGASAASPGSGGRDPLAGDDVAGTYYQVLLRHTRWAETQWDAAAGHYLLTDFSFAVVLGNAVLLTRGAYDADIAGIDRDTLEAHTLATLTHFAASNRLTGGDEWGKTLFFDTTFQLYFQLAGRLLWDRLDDATRRNLDTIAAGQAAYTTALGTDDDPLSGSWTPNGLNGGWVGDTKLEEMGVYAQSLAPGIAWAQPGTDSTAWTDWFGRWSRNETGLPAADAANPALVDGVAVSANTAHNLYDTFLVENHGSFGPHYQCELWRTSARNGIHFLTADKPLPQVLTHQPNSDRLWQTILAVMSDSGEPLMPMVADREHLYGRDVVPLAFLAQVLGDPSAAWAEAALARRLPAYQAYPPVDRITKFSGEPKYEPEARAEVAISYLLHEWRARTGAPVHALSERGVFRDAAGVVDFGTGPGLVAHQSENAWAGAVSKPGFAKFAWQPQHDDWLLRLSGSTPMFLPSSSATVRTRTVRTYEQLRDGVIGSASVLTFDTGVAGFVTLPNGAVVYATTGTADGEGTVTVQNLTMPGIDGLDGTRTYTAAEGAATVAAADSAPLPAGTARVDDLVLDHAVTARWVRMLGVRPAPTYGYSVFELAVRDGADGANLALGRPTTASSADTGHAAALATDGDAATRWAVSRADRLRADSWLAVDLGTPTEFDRVTLSWEAAAGRAYELQTSDDGTTWTSVSQYPHPDLSSTGGWLCVDGRAGFVVRGTTNPITVNGDVVTLADGPAAGAQTLLVEGHPGLDATATAAYARRAAPSASTLRVAFVADHLAVFNLSAAPVTEPVQIPQSRTEIVLFEGVQQVVREGTSLDVELAAASAALAAPRLVLTGASQHERVAEGVLAEVLDARTVRLSGSGTVLVRSAQGGASRSVTLSRRPRTITLAGTQPYPIADLALGRVTFPTNPLPEGMSDPAAAVDGDRSTGWVPGTAGRMVVDLGSSRDLASVRLTWRGRSPSVTVQTSADGLDYAELGTLAPGQQELRGPATARYVAVQVSDGQGTALRSLTVSPG